MLRSHPVTRRTALRGAAAVGGAGAMVGLAGCSLGDESTEPDPGPGGRGGEPTGPAGPSDQDVVDEAARAISRAHALARASLRRHPDLRTDLAPWIRLHAAHATELGGLVDVGAGRVPRGLSERQARTQVLAAESDLQLALVDAATAVASGALALLLSSMAAAVAQRLSLAGDR